MVLLEIYFSIKTARRIRRAVYVDSCLFKTEHIAIFQTTPRAAERFRGLAQPSCF